MQTNGNLNSSAKIGRLALSAMILLAASLVQAQIQDRPKAGPELKKLEMFVGDWKYAGSVSDTPLGPGGKFAGTATNRMILDGLFLEIKGQDKGVYGGKEIVYKGLTIRRYDSTSKNYLSQTFDNDGMVATEVWALEGRTWKTTGTMTDSKGKTYQTRSSATFSADGATLTFKAELLADDGKTWLPYWEDTNTRFNKGNERR
jgi:hypothetical protein